MNSTPHAPSSEGELLHGVLVGCSVPDSVANTLSALRLIEDVVLLPDAEPIWQREDAGERYRSTQALYKAPDGYVLSIACEGSGRFKITAASIVVDWDGGTPYTHYLQTLALALWLELRGIPCIHANALAIDEDRAIGLMAPSRGGKSTLSAALIKHGAQLCTDDMVALYPASPRGFGVYPAKPVMRLWPDSAQTFVSSSDAQVLPRVHSRFAKRELTLTDDSAVCRSRRDLVALFVLDRTEPSDPAADKNTDSDASPALTTAISPSVEPIAGAAALLQLMQNSMLADAYAALDIQLSRAVELSRLVDQVPIYRLNYASDMQQLPKVCAQILSAVS
ncbi:hypothetical protein R0135_03760 [Congregibacter variabilis]|uniref:Hpr(Ser) kinase/phosphatase n=1 Tax=Congregibacter variabilis TaxID=3081200 RepID=A0ABZ0I567_9GAMM|nr:hypothetical protein R0135_03760 [Congregibacter sp. IMCC43200]